jgi:hypothetical protein
MCEKCNFITNAHYEDMPVCPNDGDELAIDPDAPPPKDRGAEA